MERLTALSPTRALELCRRVLESEAGKSARLRLVAVRTLAHWIEEREARALLLRLMTSAEVAGARGNDLDPWVRISAALALASSSSVEAMQALGAALRHEGPAATAALEALVAHPPTELGPLLEARGSATATLVVALESLGDERAFPFLRKLVRNDRLAVRARAAIALTRLGNFETVELARYWLKRERDPELVQAAAWILALSQTRDAPRAVAGLLEKASSLAPGLELALAFPHPELVPALERRLRDCREQCDRVLTALARAGGGSAIRALARYLAHPELGQAAAYALALSADRAALDELERALTAPPLRALAARALVVRSVALDEQPSGLSEALETLLRSAVPDQRAAGAWGLGTLDRSRALALMKSPDPVLVRAAARALAGREESAEAAERWERETDAVTRAALGVALTTPRGMDRVSTPTLITRIAQGDPLAPLIARALAARDSTELRPRISALLASGDPLVRAHTAFGLGESRHPGALGLLDHAYQFEADPEVRRAIVRGLASRPESARLRTLRLARDLDADRAVRNLAHLALSGAKLALWERGPGTVWISVDTSRAEPEPLAALALVTTPSGLAVPGVTDPGGTVVMTGFGRGLLDWRLSVLGR
jgi:HEAT repeat protein